MLYPPVKRFLEGQGYEVKAEVHNCDVVAVRGDEAPVVVELKSSLSLALLCQGVDRQAVTDAVYIATPARRDAQRREIVSLCRRLGLGFLTVDVAGSARVEVHVDPAPYQPRKNKRREALLLKEFARRVGDANEGGSTRRPIMTAYRQDALRCVKHLRDRDGARVADIRRESSVARTAAILRRDVYGWFMRRSRGVYGLSPKGREAAIHYAEVLGTL